jgi:Zn-dependent M16 (insulinase) family peptidase
MIKTIQVISNEDIPDEFIDATNHDALISVVDDGSPFSEWLKSKGFTFKRHGAHPWDWLAIWW